MAEQKNKILLTGASGYVGGRLLKKLEASELPLRCLLRRPELLKHQIAPSTELVKGDVFQPESLQEAMKGIHTAYYLVHSLTSKGVFEEEEKIAAKNFAEAARVSGIQKIIYLGGLGSAEDELSEHLRSRQEVGNILRSSGIPVIEFRASIILGSGSISFEIVRALVERLPIMTTPRWVKTPTQPIGIEDVLEYLVEAYQKEFSQSEIFEIGGRDVVTYRDLMMEYAKQRKLKRWLIPVPVLTPRLSSLWLALVTPAYKRVGEKLIEGLKNPTFVRNPKALKVFSVKPMGIQEAITRALHNEDQDFIQTHWSDAFSSGKEAVSESAKKFGLRLLDARKIQVNTSPEKAFYPIQVIGGNTGWYTANLLWKMRGFVDLVLGGVGVRRGRRDPVDLQEGDAIDFWRVVAFEANKRLLLRAEMKVPGRAWLEFWVEGNQEKSTIYQVAFFDPLGLWGRLYWYSLLPFHNFIFGGMLNRIKQKAESQSALKTK